MRSTPLTARLSVLTFLALVTGLALSSVPASAGPTPRLGTTTTTSTARQVATAIEVRRTTFRPAGEFTKPPRLRARSWVVADLDTGRILAAHDRHRHLPQASTIKLLTAVTAAATVRRFPRHRVTKAEAHPQYCTCAGLKVGARYTRRALLAGMLLPSGNDAAEALAGSHPRGHRSFIRAMNARAAQLGAKNTTVVTPSGLTAWGAHSSAYDLLVFLRAAQADAVVEPILELASFDLGPRGGRTHRVYRGTDYVNSYLATNPGTQGKSGYTTPAKNTLVVSTPIDGHRIGVSTLGSPSGYSTSGARALTVWAAANWSQLRSIGKLPDAPGEPLGQPTEPPVQP